MGCRAIIHPAPALTGISDLKHFEHLSHSGLDEDADTFNSATLEFLLRQAGPAI